MFAFTVTLSAEQVRTLLGATKLKKNDKFLRERLAEYLVESAMDRARGKTITLESTRSDGTTGKDCQPGYPLTPAMYDVAKHVEMMIYRTARACPELGPENLILTCFEQNLRVWING